MKIWLACGFLLASNTLMHSALAANDPCSLLTAAQVSQVLGVAVGEGEPLGAKLCQWIQTGNPDRSGTKKVTLTMMDARGYSLRVMPVPSSSITKQPVSGVGDQANFGTTAGKLGSLAVKKADTYFAVQVWGFPVSDLEEKEKTLAQEILQKM
jgi:hypothetical protein